MNTRIMIKMVPPSKFYGNRGESSIKEAVWTHNNNSRRRYGLITTTAGGGMDS